MYNPYTGQFIPDNYSQKPQTPANLPRYEIIRVNGRNGAEMFQMSPNCSAILLDEHEPLIWFVTTDGAGYKTITPYTITLYEPAPEISNNELLERIKNLEVMLNAKSDNESNKRTKVEKQ